MDLFFILKLLVVLFFLVMFLRNSRVVWGIGLLTVSTAFLLDTIWTTFGREEILADVGFFFYVLSGALFAGAALWFWSVLRPVVATANGHVDAGATRSDGAAPVVVAEDQPDAVGDETYADPRELYEVIRTRLGPHDVRDLIFDLQFNENDVLAPDQEMVHTIARLVNRAQAEDKMGALALAVERVLTPVPPGSLPRREKLSASSPPTVLRHFLLAHYSLQGLEELATALDVDYQHFNHTNKSELARNLLRHLQRRNQMGQLVAHLQTGAPVTEED